MGKLGHAIYDPSTGGAMVIIDQRKMVMMMPIPAPSAAPQVGEAPTITKTGKHETLAGRDCEDWDVVEPVGQKHEQLCVTEGMTFFDFTSLAPPGAMAVPVGTWLKEIRERNEFPLRAVRLDPAGKELSRMEVTKIEAKPIDDALFLPPKGYMQFDATKMGNLANGMHPMKPR
jgi:Domain of unknown function (DUF4412)